jgi:hypothetical protein
MSRVFVPGTTITVREVLHGEVWLHFPETVLSDDGDVLATVQDDGCPLTFPDHPFGPHPWSHQSAWQGTTVLKLRRDEAAYSVWKIFGADGFRHWYVNFEQPVVRRDDGVDIDDHELDLVIEPDGASRWKDVEQLGPALESGRIGLEQVRAVLRAAAEVVGRLERDDRWWSPCDDWVPVR